MKKIPCLVIVYHDFSIVRACLDFLARYREQLDIIVLENFSEHTDAHIKPYVLQSVESGSVQKYFLFDKNISMNAFEVVLQEGGLGLTEADYVLVTDGDLIVEQGDWLAEQQSILGRHPDVFACGMTLDMTNLPIISVPDAVNWVDSGVECEDYKLASTGLWLLMIRSKELQQFLLHYRTNNYARFGDTLLRKYAKRIAGKKWVATKSTKAYHLTWDRYADPTHPYTKIKTESSFKQLFGHHRYCGYTLYTRKGVSKHFPLRRWLRGLRRGFAHKIQRKALSE